MNGKEKFNRCIHAFTYLTIGYFKTKVPTASLVMSLHYRYRLHVENDWIFLSTKGFQVVIGSRSALRQLSLLVHTISKDQ